MEVEWHVSIVHIVLVQGIHLVDIVIVSLGFLRFYEIVVVFDSKECLFRLVVCFEVGLIDTVLLVAQLMY